MAAKKKKTKTAAKPKPVQSKKRLAREAAEKEAKSAAAKAAKHLAKQAETAKEPFGKGKVLLRVIARGGIGSPDGDWLDRGDIISVPEGTAMRLRGSGLAEKLDEN